MAALLAIELVVADSMLGHQVTPAEVISTCSICEEERRKIVQLGVFISDTKGSAKN